MEKREFFPLFIRTSGRKAVVFGGGKIAARRIYTLNKFNFDITVVSPIICDEIEKISSEIEIIREKYSPEYLCGAYIVLACTDDREVNRCIEKYAKNKNIFVNICDSKEDCDFYFPGIVFSNDVILGIAGSGDNHKAVKDIVNKARNIFEGD